MDTLAETLADLPLPVYCWEVRALTKRIIHEHIDGHSALEQGYEWALVDAVLERAAKLQDGNVA